MRPFARKNQAAWEDFFDLLPRGGDLEARFSYV